MELRAYTENFYDQWDNFIRKSRNGTFMQERKFLNYHHPGRFKDCSLIVCDSRNKLAAVIPAALKRKDADNESVFCTHPGASHGGIVVGRNFGIDEALVLVPLLIEYCRANSFSAIEIKMVPRIYHYWPCDEIDFALRHSGFSISTTELATALPLKEITAEPHYMEENARRNIRKAEKMGVTIKESKDYSAYWGILEKNLRRRHNTRPTHTLKEILDLTHRYPREIKLFAAFYEGKMVGGVLTFLLNSRVINCFYIAHRDDYQQLRPLNLVFYKLINWGIERGYHYLDWGISTEDKGRYVNHGLFRFKEKFGGRGVLRETYSLIL